MSGHFAKMSNAEMYWRMKIANELKSLHRYYKEHAEIEEDLVHTSETKKEQKLHDDYAMMSLAAAKAVEHAIRCALSDPSYGEIYDEKPH